MDLAPLPGDPDTVSREAQKMQAAADRMSAAARILGRIAASEEFTSKATDALEGNAAEMQQVVTHAATRYRGAGEALTVYARVLHEAQLEAERARSAAASTDTALPAARVREARVALMNPLLDEPSRVDLQRDLVQAKAAFDQEVAQQRAAKTAYEAAQAKVSAAAAVAASRIEDAVRHSGLNDTFWDNARGWSDKYLVPALEAVVTVAEWVGTICTIASVVCAFIPGLQPLAAVLFAAGRVMTIASVLAQGGLALLGERTWGQFASASILALVTLGRAKYALSKQTATGAKGLDGSDLMKGMEFKDSMRYAKTYLVGGGTDAKAGLGELAKEGLQFGGGKVGEVAAGSSGKVVSDYLVEIAFDYSNADVSAISLMGGLGAAATEYAIDSAFPPDHAWSTDDLATHDADVLGDVRTADLDALMAKSFGTPGEPRLDLRMQVCSASGGGGGW
ncbi:hypothetical protein [Nocardioides flavescens]|uniref:Uncharacterized protein n=1 Tax=Nocardioides flavescens TaxID=2691959 RepID=A0A6L7EYZ0_9ACTN|nr:hypothetical protein [Nocardioides flavescens]MXG90898.1 hypothetical protein [Nocardioides flavescens]